MQCYVCGTLFEDGLENCPVCGTAMPMQEELCYNGMPPLEVELPPQERYEKMIDLWREYGNYDGGKRP